MSFSERVKDGAYLLQRVRNPISTAVASRQPGIVRWQLRAGGSFCMRGSSSDMLAVRDSILRNILPLHARHYATVVDIGAHIGSFSAKVSARADRVLAFEPVSDNYALLESMTSAGARMEMHKMAVTSDGRDVVMNRDRGNTGAHSIYEPDQRDGSERVCSLSSAEVVELADGDIDLLKVDVEGAEHEILRDGSLISASREMLIEMHPVPDGDTDVLERIETAGFQMSWTGPMVLRAFRGLPTQAL